MADEKIECHAKIDERGVPYIVDQQGRRLAGVTQITVESSVDDLVKVTCTFIAHKSGDLVVN